MTRRRLGLLLLIVGLVLNQYGFLHDLIWLKHDGAIYMGLRSYMLVAVGFVAFCGGGLLLWRS